MNKPEQFVQKPLKVNAIQWTTENLEAIQRFTRAKVSKGKDDILWYEDGVGICEARKGDWIVKDVRGTPYTCRLDIFVQTYEPVKEQPNA